MASANAKLAGLDVAQFKAASIIGNAAGTIAHTSHHLPTRKGELQPSWPIRLRRIDAHHLGTNHRFAIGIHNPARDDCSQFELQHANIEITIGRALHRTTGLMLGPTISVSASGEHAGFAGTLSIGTDVMAQVAIELGRSADWAAGVVLVNGHGGNHAAITAAVTTLSAEDRKVLGWWPSWPRRLDGGPADLHAGRIETSMMLAIDPGLVRLELAVAGADSSIDELRTRGVPAVSANGVLGDPDGASGREGEKFITAFVQDLVHQIERWRPIDTTPGTSTA